MIRSIVFDMGNVLIHWRPDVLIRRLGVPEEDRPLLSREVFGDVNWVQLDRGTVTPEQAAQRICRRLPERLHGAVRALTGGWWRGPLLPVEGMAEIIRELKAMGYGIYLLSNASTDLPRYFERIPGSECFDGRIVSADWKLLKPQPEIYRLLLQEYGLRAEECFFVDDLNINIEAALLVGMSGAVFRGAQELRGSLIQAGVPVRPASQPPAPPPSCQAEIY